MEESYTRGGETDFSSSEHQQSADLTKLDHLAVKHNTKLSSLEVKGEKVRWVLIVI